MTALRNSTGKFVGAEKDSSELPHGCGRCPVRWSGFNTAHCSVCHYTFSGVTAFDEHRITERGQRVCLTPGVGEKFRLVRPGTWGTSDEKISDSTAEDHLQVRS